MAAWRLTGPAYGMTGHPVREVEGGAVYTVCTTEVQTYGRLEWRGVVLLAAYRG